MIGPAAKMGTGNAGSLPPAVDGTIERIERRAGPLSYYVAGEGPPLLLVHSINAAASAHEIKPLFDRFRTQFRTFAVDLPGFGLSDRSDRTYEVRLFVDAILDMLDTIGATVPDTPVDVVALSLSSEFAARAATEMPGRVRTLTMITPTGFSRGSSQLRQAGATREVPGLSSILQVPLWSGPLYRLLVSKRSIRYFLEKTYGSSNIDEGLFDYAYKTSHQPGAENAPYAFLSGRLFSKDIRTIYEALELPVYVAHGTKGDFKDFTEIGWTKARSNWTVESFDTGALVHFEKPDEFDAGFHRFITASRRTADNEGSP